MNSWNRPPMVKVLSALHLAGVKPTLVGVEYYCECPSVEHDDAKGRNSLTVLASPGVYGQHLVKCWGGCSLRSILAALNLATRDLYPEGSLEWQQSSRAHLYLVPATDGEVSA